VSMLTFRYRIKDSTSQASLCKMAGAINYVWNYCQEVSLLAFRRDKILLSAYDLHNLTAGVTQDLHLSADTIQQVCTEYVIRRKQFKKLKLKWRSRKRSLGWIPFRGGDPPRSNIKLDGDTITYRGHCFRLWLSRPIEGIVKVGSFTQDARGRWYVNLQCEVADALEPPSQAELGIDLGLSNQIACSDGVIYRRDNLTRVYETLLAPAQRAHKKKRVRAIQAKIANSRHDWMHKATTAIARRASLIIIGDVSSTKLTKTFFAKSTYDASWHTIRRQLTYKAIRLAGVCVSGDERFSSVTCSACLARTGPSGLSSLGVREWACSCCGILHNRDVNAAQNILATSRAGHCTPLKGIHLRKQAEDVKGGSSRVTDTLDDRLSLTNQLAFPFLMH
jgi:putative transposase